MLHKYYYVKQYRTEQNVIKKLTRSQYKKYLFKRLLDGESTFTPCPGKVTEFNFRDRPDIWNDDQIRSELRQMKREEDEHVLAVQTKLERNQKENT